jgi:hypothetical protein
MKKHTHGMYGFFHGGDPRRFTPDREDNEDGIAAHAEACRRADEAEKAAQDPALPSPHINLPGLHVTVAPFGPGAYEYDCDDPSCPEAREPGDPELPDDPAEPDWDEQVNQDRWDGACNDALDDGMPF